MLRALELVGFKSFADRTRLEFPGGITIVVGPNGSGKSNIVDAIKWILGEQSVKSLRGKEMADVIFNGSPSRRAMNVAEATLTFDNTAGLLPLDSSEVQITRRVYRSGEGEYLINRQPCRLRDIRDLFSGTGAATEAYSVIEQGKVDVLLQASPRDRRLIFEEAAGISRFKAKKLEAIRRLERVGQNLLRLSDIVEEVESRLRAVRTQAGKARRYKEHADRLQELRTQVGLGDWRKLGVKLAGFETELAAIKDEIATSNARAERIEAQTLGLETEMGRTAEAIRACEARIARNRERIAAGESAIEHERARHRDLEEEVAKHRRQLAAMNLRAGNVQQRLRETADAVESAETGHREISRRLADEERALTELTARLDQFRNETEQRRTAHMDRMRAAATLGNETSAWESRAGAAAAAADRSRARIAELDASRQAISAELEDFRRAEREIARQAELRQADLAAAQSRLTECREQHASRGNELAELRQRLAAATERASVLRELEKRLEGVGLGVKELLLKAREATEGPLTRIRGLVADLFRVRVEQAPLVEIVLGERAGHLVAAPGVDLVAYLEREAYRFAGRVGFVWLDDRSVSNAAPGADLGGHPGVVGRADHAVETLPELAGLARRLLGQTWIVQKLAHAIALADGPGRNLSFVTLSGEVLAADGTLTVGPRQDSLGLISRRSELRALEQQLADLAARIGQVESLILQLKRQLAEGEGQVERLSVEHQRVAEAAREQRSRIGAAEQRRGELDEQRNAAAAELDAACAQHEAALRELGRVRGELAATEAGLAEMEEKITEITRQIGELEENRQARGRDATATQVELAKSEERLRNLRAGMRQFEMDRLERDRAVGEGQTQLIQSSQRARQSRWNILRAESEIAQQYLEKEAIGVETVTLVNQRELVAHERGQLAAEAQTLRGQIRKLEEKLHDKDLAATEVRHERSSLAARLRDDYGIELASLENEPSAEELRQREEVEQEIAELRRKINKIGNVNLDALAELEELEARYSGLSSQYSDLANAKASLDQIIGRINADSRRLFSETLETVRGHFQTLFRSLFGGGQADIVLEEGVDILDGGIEIVARPPGKEPRSISLLSGGEKTLTCVALLLAIFRSRPSPFCVLDEVDAALDEANISRFIGVLEEFLAWTQFIVVTHSKKTMTCANTIYGITMQESGVSKQVSVRFEDVSDNGDILVAPPPALSEADLPDTGDESRAA
ncbi:MAG: chromosome segregation protein SMC [Pirellulales bacterium]